VKQYQLCLEFPGLVLFDPVVLDALPYLGRTPLLTVVRPIMPCQGCSVRWGEAT